MRTINLVLLSLLFAVFASCSYVEHNKKVGDSIIEKIELYKKTNGHLPNSLQEIGEEKSIFCYAKEDSVNYIVWFGTTLGEGIYYYSDTKQWEDRLRGIGNWRGRSNALDRELSK